MSGLAGTRDEWLAALAAEVYGPIPPPPKSLTVTRERLPDARAEHLRLDVDGVAVDAALWLPQQPKGIVALLDFIGPIGTLTSEAFPIDRDAICALPQWHGGEGGRLDDSLRGAAMHRVPVELILSAGWGVLSSCYGSWVPDSAAHWRDTGIGRTLGEGTRAISLWAWALSRLVDAGQQLGHERVALAGHSRLGKAALWAAANDERVVAVLSNDSGCGGASLEAHQAGGETLPVMHGRYPHWILPPGPRTTDQHHLLAAIAPRGVYVASAAADDWADPPGEYLSLQLAAPQWGETLPDVDIRPGASLTRGPLGWHLRPGGHEILPHDWRRYLGFLNGLTS